MCVAWIRISVEWYYECCTRHLALISWSRSSSCASIWSLNFLYESSRAFPRESLELIRAFKTCLSREIRTIDFQINCCEWITYPLMRLSIILISTPTAALLIVDVSRALTICSTASRKFSPSGSSSEPSSRSPVNWDTRVWQRGIRRDRACLEWVLSENRDCGRTEALDAERTESLEGGRWVALDPGRDVFREGGRGRLEGRWLVLLIEGWIKRTCDRCDHGLTFTWNTLLPMMADNTLGRTVTCLSLWGSRLAS